MIDVGGFAVSSATISLRLSAAAREKLDKASIKTRRSRSYLIQRALERHLDEIASEEQEPQPASRFGTILGLAGAASARNGPRTSDDIDRHIQWLRDNA
jgi:metal-responsive CopG/Arc/MetJ family transcriptional regulator